MVWMNLLTKQKLSYRCRKQSYSYQKERQGVKLGPWDWHIHTATYKIDLMTVQPRELCSVLCNDPHGKRILKRVDMCICIADSLCCVPETNMTLYINYIPTKIKQQQNIGY